MTSVIIDDILPYTQIIAGSSQTVFDTSWTADAAADVVVFNTPVNTAANDVTQLVSSSLYNVSFVGAGNIVRVTFITAPTQFNIITITRMTPVSRANLYTNTNFTPSMLNEDFGLVTMEMQENELVDQQISPRYNYSAQIDHVIDIILPILTANQTWVKNPANTAFIPYVLPASGIAPAGASYITLTDWTASLPTSLPLSTIAQGLLVNLPGSTTLSAVSIAGTGNQITIANGSGLGTIGISIPNNPIIPGSAGMGIPIGTTAQRVTPGSNISMRFNTDTLDIEYWNGTTWVQLEDSTDLADLASHAAGKGASLVGLQNQSNVSNKTVQDLANAEVLLFGANTTFQNGLLLTAGSNITLTAGVGTLTIDSSNTGGTVTSFSAGNLSPLFTTSVANPTTTPALSFALSTAAANTYFGNASGITASPSFTAAAALSKTDDTNVTLTLGGNPTVALLAATSLTLGWTGILGIPRGGTGVSSVTTTPTAGAFAGWDSNKNLSANNFLAGYTTTATAASTTTLTVASTYLQFFTGSTTQTIVMPDVSTLVLGQQFEIVNNSSGNLTVQSSGGNTILTMTTNTVAYLTCIAITGTSAASWYFEYVNQVSSTGTVTSVGSGTGLTGGPITTTGTLSFASIAANSLWANVTAGTAVPTVIGTNTFLQSVSQQIFATAGTFTYTPTTGTKFVKIKCQGGGGGSGGCTAAVGQAAASGAGGGGGYSEGIYPIATVLGAGSTAQIVVGAGGAFGANTGANGSTGGLSKLTANGGAGSIIIQATGGLGGNGMLATAGISFADGGLGGIGSLGAINSQGQNGGSGLTFAAAGGSYSGVGGSSVLGGGGQPSTNAGDGGPGNVYGGGAGGAATLNTTTARQGGPGAIGIIYIEEFIAI